MKTKNIVFGLATVALSIAIPQNAQAASVNVFSSDFNSTLPSEISPGTATLTGVQGFNGLGTTGNQFSGNFLRSETGNTVTLTLNNLPTHDRLNLSLLFAAIDSLDGTGTFPQGDFFQVLVDGNSVFYESFANARLDQIQSYVPPVGAQLARRVDLGFSAGLPEYLDSAYDFGVDPRFTNIAHTASTATIQFSIVGAGIQSLSDESWAMDNLRVDVLNSATAVPEPFTIIGTIIGGTAALRLRKKLKADSMDRN